MKNHKESLTFSEGCTSLTDKILNSLAGLYVILVMHNRFLPFLGVLLFGSTAALFADQTVEEFSDKELAEIDWEVVNDGVMGGLSEGKMSVSEQGVMRFHGHLSLENNGGFSTIRSGDVELDLSKAAGLLLRVKGDGRTYEARLATDETWRGMEITFKGQFKTVADKWVEVKVPFSSFKGTFRGMDLSDRVFDPAKIRRLGILLADKKQGEFEIEVDWIRSYKETGEKPTEAADSEKQDSTE